MKIFKLIFITFCSLLASGLFAQQDSQYTQYMYNTMSINPAYAGSRGALSLAAMYRNQWQGVQGAPETQTLNVHTPLRNSPVGLGFSVFNDQIGEGVMQETSFDIDFSYTIRTAQWAQLSFGLKAGGHLLNVDFSNLDQYDPEFTGADNIDNKFSPNVGAGIYYHTDLFYLGFSVPNILETKHFDESNNSNSSTSYVAKERINYYLLGGYVFDLNYIWKFKPTILTKVVTGAPVQVDLSANFLFDDKVTFGAGYRLGKTLTGMAAFQLSDALLMGLAYDREMSELGNARFSNGSLELFIRFEFSRNFNRITSPRFF